MASDVASDIVSGRTGSSVAPIDRPGPARTALRAGQLRRRRRGAMLFAAFAFPNLVLIAVFAYWPILQNVYLSFTDWDFISPTLNLVGLANYQSLFSSNGFGSVLGRTLLWVVVVVVITMIVGFAIALLFWQRIRGTAGVRTLVFAPHVLSGAALATVWLFIFDPNYGLSRAVFGLVGARSPAWTTDASWALPALIVVSVWKGLGFVAIVYGVAIQQIPTEVIEAARIDGAGGWSLVRQVIWPLVSPTTFFLVITQTLGAFQAFDLIAMMTGGGPGLASTTLSWFIYDEAFNRTDIGVSSAASVIMFVILLAVTALQFRFVERRVHY